jgi:hypothetical protein
MGDCKAVGATSSGKGTHKMNGFLIIDAIVMTIVGAFVGSLKQRTGVGAALGFFLGIIGVIITACLPRKY